MSEVITSDRMQEVQKQLGALVYDVAGQLWAEAFKARGLEASPEYTGRKITLLSGGLFRGEPIQAVIDDRYQLSDEETDMRTVTVSGKTHEDVNFEQTIGVLPDGTISQAPVARIGSREDFSALGIANMLDGLNFLALDRGITIGFDIAEQLIDRTAEAAASV